MGMKLPRLSMVRAGRTSVAIAARTLTRGSVTAYSAASEAAAAACRWQRLLCWASLTLPPPRRTSHCETQYRTRHRHRRAGALRSSAACPAWAALAAAPAPAPGTARIPVPQVQGTAQGATAVGLGACNQQAVVTRGIQVSGDHRSTRESLVSPSNNLSPTLTVLYLPLHAALFFVSPSVFQCHMDGLWRHQVSNINAISGDPYTGDCALNLNLTNWVCFTRGIKKFQISLSISKEFDTYNVSSEQ